MTFDNAASYQEIEVSSQPLLVPAIPKNHQCNVCKKAFETKDNLILHLKRKHKGPNGYMCDICGATFHSNDAFEIEITYVYLVQESQRVFSLENFIFVLDDAFR